MDGILVNWCHEYLWGGRAQFFIVSRLFYCFSFSEFSELKKNIHKIEISTRWGYIFYCCFFLFVCVVLLCFFFYNFILGCWFIGYPAPVTTIIFLDDDIIVIISDIFYRLYSNKYTFWNLPGVLDKDTVTAGCFTSREARTGLFWKKLFCLRLKDEQMQIALMILLI